MVKKVKKEVKKRYYGIVKVLEAENFCWLSKQDKFGYSLGLSFDKRTVWLTGLRFASVKEIKRALKTNTIFVHLKGK